MTEYAQMSFFDGAEHYKITKPIRLIELFAGIGAQAKALERIGANFEHYRICEFDKYAVRSYNAIHGTDFSTSDITKISASDLGIVDTDKYEYIMTYSFPCQDLSSAGKQKGMEKGSGTRSGLLWEVERLLRECTELPQVLLMENVPEVIGAKNIAHFADWIKFLESKGYKNYWQVLNAKDYGVPQNRNRCFMVSLLGDWLYDFPAGEQLYLRLKDMLETEVDKKYFLSDSIVRYFVKHTEESIEKGNGFRFSPTFGDCVGKAITTRAGGRMDDNFIYQIPHGYNKGGIKSGKICPPITSSAFEQNNFVLRFYKQAQETMEENDVEIGDTIDAYNKKVNNTGISPTITTRPEGFKTAILAVVEPKVLENCRVRKLTPRECFRLMGFDDTDFDKAQAVNSNSQLYKQAGNSIVVNVLEAIFRRLL